MPVNTPPKPEGRGLRGATVKWLAAVAIVAVVALIVAAELYFSRDDSFPSSGAAPAVTQKTSTPPTLNLFTPPGASVPNAGSAAKSATPEAEIAMVVGNTGEKFHVDAKGRLVQNEQTRLHVEALVALTDPSKLYDAVEGEVRNLPTGAAARARELVERYKTYIDDQIKLYPPGIAPVTEDEMLAQIDGLHALRVAHFGAKTAASFYGEEEAVNRELVELMRVENDPTLNMEQKAERAQAMRDKLHRVSEIERANREAARRKQFAQEQPAVEK
jgi:lipase chaperone LimK